MCLTGEPRVETALSADFPLFRDGAGRVCGATVIATGCDGTSRSGMIHPKWVNRLTGPSCQLAGRPKSSSLNEGVTGVCGFSDSGARRP